MRFITKAVCIGLSLVMMLGGITGCSARKEKSKNDRHTYTVEEVLDRCGLADKDEWNSDKSIHYYAIHEDEDYDTINIYDEESVYNGCHFTVYKSVRAAERAFEERREYYEPNSNDYISGGNYVGGWESGVCDASIKSFVYISGNLIITYQDLFVSSWGDSEETVDREAVQSYREQRAAEAEEMHSRIIAEW